MAFFSRKKRDPIKEFTKEELDRRENDIPSLEKWEKGSPFEYDEDPLTSPEGNKKPIPASIEYFSEKQIDEKTPKEEKIVKEVPQSKEPMGEMPDFDRLLFEKPQIQPTPKKEEEEKIEEKTFEELAAEYKGKEIVDFSKTSLADEDKINELEKKHMNFYSILSKIQDTHVASDFKSAYDIQDRISYLLNHKTLLYKSLVSQLLIYLDSIIEKMERYHENISEKQKKFNRYNRKVSELQKYKFKTDESIKIINKNRDMAHSELDIQKKNAEETP